MTVAKRIIPCLDVTDGRVVKGINFVELKDAGDPVEIAKQYNEEGADEIPFLDITASSDNRGLIFDIIEKVAKQIFIPLTVGGGVRSCDDIRNLLNAGADKVGINTSAINNPDLVAESSARFGSQAIVVAIDAKKVDNHWEVFTHGVEMPLELMPLCGLRKWSLWERVSYSLQVWIKMEQKQGSITSLINLSQKKLMFQLLHLEA